MTAMQARMGVAPGWGGGRRLVELLGRRKALEILLSCSKISAEEGQQLGFFDAVLTEPQALAQTEGWLQGQISGHGLFKISCLVFCIFLSYFLYCTSKYFYRIY